MTLIRSIMLCAMLATAITIAVPVPSQEPGETKVHTIVTHSPDPYLIILPPHIRPTLFKPIDDNRHRVLKRPDPIERRNMTHFVTAVPKRAINLFLKFTHLRIHIDHGHNGELAAFPKSHLSSTKVRRQSSVAGRLMFGAVQGLVQAGSALAGDHIAVELTGNDRDHPQKTKEQLKEAEEEEEEEKEAEKDEEEAEGKE